MSGKVLERKREKWSWIDRDLVLSALACLALYLTFRSLDAFEALFRFTRDFEQYEVDEIFLLFASLPLPVVWLAYRRTKRLKQAFDARLKLEQQLAQLRRLESLGMMVGGIAHELGNQILPIVTMSELLKKNVAFDYEDHRKLELMYEAAVKAQETISKILVFSKTQDAAPASCDVVEVAHQTYELLKITCPKTVSLKLHCEPDLGFVGLSANELQDILVNLVTNSFDALEKQRGTVTLDIKRKTDAGSGEKRLSKQWITIEVTDTGAGISEGDKDKIFDPFFTTKAVGKGTGLGLAMVHSMVTAAGGRIACDTVLYQGTTFTIDFPKIDQ